MVRENPVNQSGSVALSTEAMRGPPWRNSLITMALLTQEPGYEPGGRGFKSCRARQFSKGYDLQERSFRGLPDPCRTLYPPLSRRSVRDAQDTACAFAV
jgi:hypothetical protein